MFRLHNTLRHIVELLGCPVQAQGLNTMILVSPFLLRVFHDRALQRTASLTFFALICEKCTTWALEMEMYLSFKGLSTAAASFPETWVQVQVICFGLNEMVTPRRLQR